MKKEALRKTIREFAGTYEYSNLLTIDDAGHPKGRMMENTPVGDDLVFWFATFAQSDKVREIKNNEKAGVFLYRPSDHSSISVRGRAEIVTDDSIKSKKWQDKWTKFWKSPEDPAYTLIKVIPDQIIYLDFPNHQKETLDL